MDRSPARRIREDARVGERWVIRHRLPDGSATDVIGWIERVNDHEIAIRSIGSGLERLALADIVLARRAPAAAGGGDPLRTSPADLEQIALPGWLAISEPLGEWTLRAAGGFTGRANSCLAVGDPGMPSDKAAARIRRYAVEHGIPAWAQVVSGSEEEHALEQLGWQPVYVQVEVLAVRLAELLADTQPDPRVQVSEQLDRRWRRAYDESRPNQADPDLLGMILEGRPPRAFAGAGTPDGLFTIGRGHLNRGWLGLASIWTRPELRRLGWGRRIVLALGHWGARQGARHVYLQVAAANTEALRAYEAMGLRPHHRYNYLASPE
jgi:ribosomal protein S18 acetylase RimI-like enzyme